MTTTIATTVVNTRHELYDEFIGRLSMLGNPFRIGVDGSREEVIARHIVKSLYGKRLGCYCHPLACHGDNYVVLTEELNR